MTPRGDNFKAGLFVVVGLALAFLMVFLLSDFERLFQRRQIIRVYYQLDDGLQGLKDGASVTLGDQPIGEVTAIEDHQETGAGGERVVGKVVSAKIPRRYHIYQNAVIELKSQLLGGGARLNIRSVGEGAPYNPATTLEGAIAGSAQIRDLLETAGIQETQRRQLQAIIANVEAITGKVREDLPPVTATLRRVMEKAEPLAEDAQKAVADLRAAAAEVRTLVADARTRSALWMDRLDSITGSADESLARANKLLKDKDPDLRATIDNVKQVTQTVRDKTLAQISDALDKAAAALENVRASTVELRTLAVAQRPTLERTLANLSLTADQLKLTAIEVRRSPWRLLYRPGDKEIATDNLYDAARSFALAASTLDATTNSLRSLTADKFTDPQKVADALEYLEKVLARFKDAETQFWRALEGKPPVAEDKD